MMGCATWKLLAIGLIFSPTPHCFQLLLNSDSRSFSEVLSVLEILKNLEGNLHQMVTKKTGLPTVATFNHRFRVNSSSISHERKFKIEEHLILLTQLSHL